MKLPTLFDDQSEIAYRELKQKFKSNTLPSIYSVCEDGSVSTVPGYVSYTTSGKLLPEYGSLSEMEIALLVEGSNCFYGGVCMKNNLAFVCTIYTD